MYYFKKYYEMLRKSTKLLRSRKLEEDSVEHAVYPAWADDGRVLRDVISDGDVSSPHWFMPWCGAWGTGMLSRPFAKQSSRACREPDPSVRRFAFRTRHIEPSDLHRWDPVVADTRYHISLTKIASKSDK
ncbi:hypothetical protein SFRURICE_008323 [Spodoptera frugiperda]|nr:hypothetical protein SFRURICE_008323 [Spodoptera frugiperda]